MSNQKKIFVILHGGWQCSLGWRTIGSLLGQAEYRAVLLDLPGHGSQSGVPFHKINFHTYVNYVSHHVQELQKQAPIILVGHSMSGMVISQVAQNIPVDRLIYISAFLPINNESLLDIAEYSPIIGISKNMIFNPKTKCISLNKEGLDQLFFNGCPSEKMGKAISRLQDQPLLPFYGKVQLTEDRFGQVPKTYVECTRDYTLSIKLQRSMYKRWPCSVYSLDSGHCPFYSIPETLTEVLIDCEKNG